MIGGLFACISAFFSRHRDPALENLALRQQLAVFKPQSQTWRTFLDNHLGDICAIDFFTVPTATFRALFVLVVLAHHRRRIVYVNATANPTADWTAQQMVEAFPEESAPRYLTRVRDQIYGAEFRRRVQGMGIEEVITAARSPWQNPFAERVIGSLRGECLDHVIVLNENHLGAGPIWLFRRIRPNREPSSHRIWER